MGIGRRFYHSFCLAGLPFRLMPALVMTDFGQSPYTFVLWVYLALLINPTAFAHAERSTSSSFTSARFPRMP